MPGLYGRTPGVEDYDDDETVWPIEDREVDADEAAERRQEVVEAELVEPRETQPLSSLARSLASGIPEEGFEIDDAPIVETGTDPVLAAASARLLRCLRDERPDSEAGSYVASISHILEDVESALAGYNLDVRTRQSDVRSDSESLPLSKR